MRAAFAAVAVAAALGALPAAAVAAAPRGGGNPTDQTPAALFETALYRHFEGDAPAALEAVRQAHVADPRNFHALNLWLALRLQQVNGERDSHAWAEDYRRFLREVPAQAALADRVLPNDPRLGVPLAMTQTIAKRVLPDRKHDIVATLLQVVDGPRHFTREVAVLAAADNGTEALRRALEARAQGPGATANHHFYLAETLAQALNRPGAARPHYERAHELARAAGDLTPFEAALLAEAFAKLGDHERAVRVAAEAASGATEFLAYEAMAKTHRVKARALRGDAARAELRAAGRAARRSIELRPDYPDAYLTAALIRYDQGDPLAAERLWGKALSLDPFVLDEYAQKRGFIRLEGDRVVKGHFGGRSAPVVSLGFFLAGQGKPFATAGYKFAEGWVIDHFGETALYRSVAGGWQHAAGALRAAWTFGPLGLLRRRRLAAFVGAAAGRSAGWRLVGAFGVAGAALLYAFYADAASKAYPLGDLVQPPPAVGWITLSCLVVSLGAHEIAHRVAARRAGLQPALALWWPGVAMCAAGAALLGNAYAFTHGSRIDGDVDARAAGRVAWAGPGASIATAGLAAVLFALLRWPVFKLLLLINLGLASFSLLPFGPLDGVGAERYHKPWYVRIGLLLNTFGIAVEAGFVL